MFCYHFLGSIYLWTIQKENFLKRAGQSSAMLILFAYRGGKLLAANI